MVLHRVLRGNHQKRLRQRVRMRIDRDLAFVHGFEQRRLRLGRGAVDFIGEQDVGKNRPALELKLLFDGRVDGNSQNIRWQHVAGELHPLKTAVDGPRQSLAESSLAHSGNPFNQQMPASKHRHQGKTDYVVLTANYLAEYVFQLRRAMGRGNGGFGRHLRNSTMHVRMLRGGRGITNVTRQPSALSETLYGSGAGAFS